MREAARLRRRRLPRWYWLVLGLFGTALGAAAIAAALVMGPLGNLLGMPYRSFYVPSEAMMPTLLRQDRLIARMGLPADLRRGMIILFSVGDSVWIKRLAALPGDRVEFVGGEFFLNGHRVPREPLGEYPLAGVFPPGPAQLYAERLPGEDRSHQILDHHRSPGDDFGPTVVPEGHVFVLGDNRDHSADSRYPRAEMGVEMLPLSDIRGVARFVYWRADGGFGNWPLTD